MSLNTLKKMIIFSNEKNKSIIEKIIDDESIIQNRSASSLIEQHLLNDLLPTNEEASFWLQFLYDGSWGIGEVLNAAFSYLASGINWEAKYDNAFELVRVAHNWECIAHNTTDINAPEMHHFLSQLDSIANKLDNIATESNKNQYEAQKEASWAKKLYNIAQNEPENLKFSDIYQIILNNWESLKNWSITYRILLDMTKMQKNWRNTPETRYELTHILTTISNDWH